MSRRLSASNGCAGVSSRIPIDLNSSVFSSSVVMRSRSSSCDSCSVAEIKRCGKVWSSVWACLPYPAMVSLSRFWKSRLHSSTREVRTVIDIELPTSSRHQFVIPVAMKRIGDQGDCVHLRLGHSDARLCLPGRSEKIREVVCRFGAHVPIRAVWLARAADWAVRRRPGARVTRGTSASSNRTARSAGCVVNWRAPPATGTDGSVAANASRSNSTRRGGPAADRQPPLPRTGRKVAAGIPDGGLAHATVGRAAARARDRSTRPSRRRCRRRVRTAAARLT